MPASLATIARTQWKNQFAVVWRTNASDKILFVFLKGSQNRLRCAGIGGIGSVDLDA
ncbi:hypothetical protein RBSWK_00108 [Rhodopirellula baltica SWK14]|uniref:Uncharacterized protein n=1 Tax=Rhodopirellula baltica SWK14 TaxID=993516 RepID=L7CP51_RHOBT|nr:hypothetical protein RBSWK_00108 [Rhodopirellula baltica SWK14]